MIPLLSPSWWRQLAIKARWRRGRLNEVRFWDRYLGSGGLRWPEDFKQRLNQDRQLSPDLAKLLQAGGGTPRVLDVGAGPLTVLGQHLEGQPLDLVALDPLAEDYDQLLAKHQIVPPVRTRPGKAEELDRHFPANSFDLAHARNCLDHGINPVIAVLQMFEVIKPGGWVVLKHHPDEAITENWRGLHQWNFGRNEQGEFIIGSRHEAVNMTRLLSPRATVRCELTHDGAEAWLIVHIHKPLPA